MSFYFPCLLKIGSGFLKIQYGNLYVLCRAFCSVCIITDKCGFKSPNTCYLEGDLSRWFSTVCDMPWPLWGLFILFEIHKVTWICHLFLLALENSQILYFKISYLLHSLSSWTPFEHMLFFLYLLCHSLFVSFCLWCILVFTDLISKGILCVWWATIDDFFFSIWLSWLHNDIYT